MFNSYFSLSSLGFINLTVLAFPPLLLKYFWFLYSICTLQIFIDFLVFPQSLAKSCIFSAYNLPDYLHKSMPTLLVSFLLLCLFDLYLSESEVFKTASIYSTASVTTIANTLVIIFLSYLTLKLFLKNFITNLDLFNHPFLSRPSRKQQSLVKR